MYEMAEFLKHAPHRPGGKKFKVILCPCLYFVHTRTSEAILNTVYRIVNC